MKNKIIAVLLCVSLLLTLSVGVSADGLSVAPDTDTQIINTKALQPVSEQGNATRSETSEIVSGAVYRIKNVGSGKYMNVHYGNDANGTNIYQWTADGSTEQKFRVVYFAGSDSYLIYAMCSSNGSNRVLDVTDTGVNLENGANIKLYDPCEPFSQQMVIISLGSGKYRISMKNNTTLGLSAYGTANGSADGTSSTSAGNIFVSTYTGASNQQWQFELLQNPPNPVGSLDSVTTSQIGGWAYQTGLPDTPIWVHFYITNNSTNQQTFLSELAGNYRSDLESLGYGDGEHAFHHTMNWYDYPAGTYTVRAYGIGSQGVNPEISNSPKTFTVRNMTGVVDSLNSSGISGWAWKPDAPNNTVEVHVYVRNSADETVGVYNTWASAYRSDLENAGYGDGEHAFSISIDWSTLPKESLRVTAYAIDGTGIHPAFYDGYYNNASAHGAITLYGIKHSDTSDRKLYYTDAVKIGISNIGVTETRGLYVGTTATQALHNMKSSMIWVVHTHGWKQGVLFNNSTSGETSLVYENINNLESNALAGERCVIYGTCSAGEGGAGAENMVNITYAKGAMTVIGWNSTTYVSQMNTWLEAFLVSCGEGNTINNAIVDANRAVSENHMGDMGGLDAIYYAGSITQKLVS